MHKVSTTMMWLQTKKPAAAYVPSPVVQTQLVCQMDLLTLLGSSVLAAVVEGSCNTDGTEAIWVA
jgi:hypothetical protein